MRIGFRGELSDEPVVRAGFIGCGSHAFRNVYPTLQFVPVELAAVCDLKRDKAQAFAKQFGAADAYDDFEEMIARDDIDAVFVVTGYDERGRPRYPAIAARCLEAGKHVWMEKPPAATCAEIEGMQAAAEASGKHVVVGFKKMFNPANNKAKALMGDESFGAVAMASCQSPQRVPPVAEFRKYLAGENVGQVRGFLDHICHPVSVLLLLLGMPRTMFYQRGETGAGLATFTFASGAVAVLAFTAGAAKDGGMERTMIVSDRGRHIVVDNNLRVTLRRDAKLAYGASPDYYVAPPEEASSVWEPEFSLGQLYNKSLFIQGFYAEVNEFARCVLTGRAPTRGTLEQAWQATRVFEAFAEGPGKVIEL